MITDPTAEGLPAIARSPEFRHVLDTLPAFVWCAASDGAIVFLNRRGLEYTGFSPSQIAGWNWRDSNILHPDDLQPLFDAWQAIVASGREGEIQARMRRFDGEYRWFLFRVAPLYDAGGTLIAWWGVDIEIDERKQAEDNLRRALAETTGILEQRRRAEALLAGEKRLLEMMASGEALPPLLATLCELVEQLAPECLCGVLLVDPAGARLHHAAGPSLPAGYNEAIHGRPIDPEAGPCGMAAFLKQQVLVADVASDPRWTSGWRTLATVHGLRACWSTPVLSPEGTILGTFAVYWRQPGGPGAEHQNIIERMTHLAAVAINRKRAEDALSEVRSELAHVARVTTLGELTAAIAHEINQPLAAIVNNANAGMRWLAAGRADQARASVALVVADGHRASDIITRIRAMIEKRPPQKGPLVLDRALREVLDLARSQAGRHGVTMELHLPADLPPVWADRVQVQQVALNLVMNAIEAMAESPETARLLTVTASQADETTVRVDFHDRGCGLTPEQSERLFDAFYTTKSKGLGMGLPISRGIIQAHHGHLRAVPNPDHGATFQLTLPVAPEEAS
jgi:PAS domain S-box-containing protein